MDLTVNFSGLWNAHAVSIEVRRGNAKIHARYMPAMLTLAKATGFLLLWPAVWV